MPGGRYLVAMLDAVLDRATPGDWDAVNGCIARVGSIETDARFRHGRLSPETIEFYGGDLVAESMNMGDAVAIAALRNCWPEVAREFRALVDENSRQRRTIADLQSELDDQRELVAFIRSARYQPPASSLIPAERNPELVYPFVHLPGVEIPATVTLCGLPFSDTVRRAWYSLPGYPTRYDIESRQAIPVDAELPPERFCPVCIAALNDVCGEPDLGDLDNAV
jgi:hypothetical protein